jgi:hypothetical protein
MAITTAKVTYSLKPETVLRIEELAVKWGVPKSEVVGRVVDKAALEEITQPQRTPLEALHWLQKHGISAEVARKWKAEIRRERRASGLKRG